MIQKDKIHLNWKDVLAIIIAIYTIFLPWALAIIGIYALLLCIFNRI